MTVLRLSAQLPGQRAQRFRGPAQRRHRVTPRFGVDQLVPRVGQARIQLPGTLAAPAGNAGAAQLRLLRGIGSRPGQPPKKASLSALTLSWSVAVWFRLSGSVPLAEGPGYISHERW